MYTMSVIGLIIYPIGFIILLMALEGAENSIGILQVVLVLFIYALVYFIVGLVHSIRCRKKNKKLKNFRDRGYRIKMEFLNIFQMYSLLLIF